MEFSRPESGDSLESLGTETGVGHLSLLQGDLPNPGIEPRSPALQADSLPSEPPLYYDQETKIQIRGCFLSIELE